MKNLVLPFTNVINSLYARQASEKTKAAHRVRAILNNQVYLGMLRKQLAHTQEVHDNIEQFVPLIKMTDIQELTPHILNS